MGFYDWLKLKINTNFKISINEWNELGYEAQTLQNRCRNCVRHEDAGTRHGHIRDSPFTVSLFFFMFFFFHVGHVGEKAGHSEEKRSNLISKSEEKKEGREN